MFSRWRRDAALACGAAVLALLPLRAATAQVPSSAQEGLVEVRAQRLPPLTVVIMVDSAGTLLLPVLELTRHLGFAPATVDDVVSLPRLGGGAVRIDVRARTIVVGRDTIPLTPAELLRGEAEVYLRAERLADLIEADLAFDPAALVVSLARTAPFPAQQRAIAEQRRAMMLAGPASLHARAADAVPYRPVSGGAIVDWQLATSGTDPFELTTLRTHTGIAVFGGDLTAGGTLSLGRAPRDLVSDVDLLYQRFFPHGGAVKQVRVGDLASSGLFARYVRGAELSNRPWLRDVQYGEVLLQPDLPAGWDYEVFQGNQLLGFSTPGSREAVTVPLRGGTTPVQVRLFGPAGEEIISTLLYQLPMTMLRPGVFEYVVGGGECEGSPCDRFAHADLRYGASSRITIGGGAEYVADTAGTVIRPYAVGSFTTGRFMIGELQLMPGALTSGLFTLFPREHSTAWLRGSISRPGFGAISLVPDDDSRWDTDLAWEERTPPSALSRSRISAIRVGTGAGGRVGTGIERWRVTATGSFRAGRAEARYEYQKLLPEPHIVSLSTLVLVPVRVGAGTYRPLVQGSVGADRLGFRIGDLGLTVHPAASTQLSASMQWSRGSRGPALSLAWMMRTGGVQSFVRATGGRDGGASSAAVLSGSATWAPSGVLTGSATGRTGYAGLHGVVFFDNDGDGVFSAGDEVLPHANVVVAGTPVTADVGGRYHAWNLQPYAPATVAVDSARIPDPSWTVAGPPIVVRPAPNTAVRVDVPLTRTRELIGSLVAGTGVRTVASLTLHITDLATAEVATTVTFSDGQFYVSRMRPGRYRLTVAPSSLDLVHATPHPPVIDFVVPATGGDPVVELPPILLEGR